MCSIYSAKKLFINIFFSFKSLLHTPKFTRDLKCVQNIINFFEREETKFFPPVRGVNIANVCNEQ